MIFFRGVSWYSSKGRNSSEILQRVSEIPQRGLSSPIDTFLMTGPIQWARGDVGLKPTAAARPQGALVSWRLRPDADISRSASSAAICDVIALQKSELEVP